MNFKVFHDALNEEVTERDISVDKILKELKDIGTRNEDKQKVLLEKMKQTATVIFIQESIVTT